ncbi:hypothetical protein [Haemophilus pittmaniae]|uniref:hypothetical protein n=1 Tax=Haemophilus pittmaniae TaxID=249188 RepID=UPI001584F331|nr:hypothetical protein [Haemophilus pittmaniae]
MILLGENKKAAIMARNAPSKTKVLLKNDAKLLILLGENAKRSHYGAKRPMQNQNFV